MAADQVSHPIKSKKTVSPSKSAVTEKTKPDPDEIIEKGNMNERLSVLKEAQEGKVRFSERKLQEARSAEKNHFIRRQINKALVDQSATGIVALLLDDLANNSGAVVRQGAAQDLGKFITHSGVPQALAEALRSDGSPEVRYSCALSLALSRSFIAFQALEQASRDTDPNLRRQVAFSLSRHSSEMAKRILERLSQDPDESVRDMAKRGLK